MNDVTLVIFFVKNTSYKSGTGASESWEKFSFPVDAAGKMCSMVWVKWQSLFGGQLQEANLKGIRQPARVQCPYIPSLYEAIQTKEVVVYKYPGVDPVYKDGQPNFSSPCWYKITSGAENIHEEQRRLEFQVQRYEVN